MSFNPNDLNRRASDQRIGNRQTGVAMPTIWGSANGDPDMRKLYCDELGQSTMTTDGPNGMRCGFLTTIMGDSISHMPGEPVIKHHTATSDTGGTYVYTGFNVPPHSESELISNCGSLTPPDGASYPWVYYHVIGSGMDPGYYYYLSPSEGPFPGKGPGWPS